MIEVIFKRIFHIPQMIVVLSLMALACLPIALRELIRDSGTNLLLPITLSGAILAWLLTHLKVRNSLSGFALLFLGPLALYIRIGQLGDSLFQFIKQVIILVPAFYNWLFNKIPPDLSIFLSSRAEFLQKALAFSGRLFAWCAGLLQGTQIEDPVIRTLIWSMALWLIAVWAGWQIYHNKRTMAGMLPSTIPLIFILEYTGEELVYLWFHLALLLFLFGLTHTHNLLSRWHTSHTDFAESTSLDTLALVGAITLGLVSVSFFVFSFSLKDLLDDLREKRIAASNQSETGLLGLEPAKEVFIKIGSERGLPRSYLLTAGPELSTQLAMTISTGDLPPMSLSAHPTVPHYYWRSLTYAKYTGSGWTNPTFLAENISADHAVVETPAPNRRVIHAEVTFPDDTGGRLYWTGTLVRADVPFQTAWIHKAEDGSLPGTDMLAALASVETYDVESVLLDVKARDLRNSPSVYPQWVRERFLALPDSVPERVRALARDLTASEPTAYDRALAIQNYLRGYPYTLDIPAPPGGRDVADYFLFDLKQGYCDYYATAMVVLARAAGLPARLVVGYASGSYDLERAQYVVTENYAHSWVDIYFADIGWVEFEPTASQPVIFHEEENQSNTSVAEVLPVAISSKERFASFFQGIFKYAWIPAFFIFSCGLLWIGFDSLRLNRIDPSRTIQLLYKRLRRVARPVTGYAWRNQTAHSYSMALIERISMIETSDRLQNWLMPSRSEIDQLTDLFSRSLFAPLPPSRAEADDAIKTWSRLRWRLALANILRFKKQGTV